MTKVKYTEKDGEITLTFPKGIRAEELLENLREANEILDGQDFADSCRQLADMEVARKEMRFHQDVKSL